MVNAVTKQRHGVDVWRCFSKEEERARVQSDVIIFYVNTRKKKIKRKLTRSRK